MIVLIRFFILWFIFLKVIFFKFKVLINFIVLKCLLIFEIVFCFIFFLLNIVFFIGFLNFIISMIWNINIIIINDIKIGDYLYIKYKNNII